MDKVARQKQSRHGQMLGGTVHPAAGASERIKLFAKWNTLVAPKSEESDCWPIGLNFEDYFEDCIFLELKFQK